MKKVELVLWFQCNCRCVFCVIDERTARQTMSARAAIRHLAQAREAGATEVDFGGGEPTLRKDLPELARAAARLGFSRIGVRSNGLLLCYPDFVETLMRSGVDHFAVSVWGHAPVVHDGLSRTEGSFEMLEMGAKHVVDLGGDISADVLLTDKSVADLRELVGHFADIGIRRFRMSLYCLFGSNFTSPELLPSMTSAGSAIVHTAAALEHKGVRLFTTHIPFCFLRPREELYSKTSDLEIEIITPGGSFPAENSPFEAGVKTEKCKGCAKQDLCGGIRPEYLERFSDLEIEPILGPRQNAHAGAV